MGKRMVKCLVCGAIFEEGAEVCPVCGVGPENFIPMEPEEDEADSMDTDERFVILGTGTAAVSAATAIRKHNEDCDILMISNERALPYNRPMLTKKMLHNNGREAFAIHTAEWYEQRHIRLMTNEIVSSLNPQLRQVTLSDDTVISYDKCIYALGARCFVPSFPGTHLPEVVTIRTLDDIERVAKLTQAASRAVVIGGGVLGLEAAWELKKAGLQVDVLENAQRLLQRQLDEEASALLQRIATDGGIAIHTMAATECVEGDEHVTGVRLKDGTTLPAQLVVISTGVRPNIQIAEQAGLSVQRAVVVNAHMETSAPHVYACGDCAEFEGVNYSIWPEATRMGQVAGENAAGISTEYRNPLPAITLNTMNTALFAIGDMGTDPQKQYEVKRTYDAEQKTMQTEYRLDGKLVGGILIGDTSGMQKLMKEASA